MTTLSNLEAVLIGLVVAGFFVVRQFSVRRVANDDEQGNTVGDDGGQFVGLVADAGVVRHAHPVPRGDQLQPLLVRAGWREVIGVTLHAKAGLSQDRRKLVA